MSLTCEQVRDLAAGFVLDALEPDEAEAMRTHLAECAEPHLEVYELGAVVPHLADVLEPIEPPAGLRRRIMAAASAEASQRAVRAAPGAAVTEPWSMDPAAAQVGSAHGRPLWSPAWLVAGLAFAMVVALGTFGLFQQSELAAAREYERAVATVLDVAQQPGSQLAILSSDQPMGAQGLAAVGADGQLAIAVRALPATAGDEVYEAWVIAGDAAPVAVGGFRVGREATGWLVTSHDVPGRELALAITLEAAPGATAPSGPIVLSGQAGGPPS